MPVKPIGQTLERVKILQASVDFLLQLARFFGTTWCCGQAIELFSRITRMLEARYDFHKWKMSSRGRSEQRSNSNEANA